MTSTLPALRIAGPDDVEVVADLVAASFLDLEVIAWLVPDRNKRYTRSRDWYRLYVEHAIGGAGQVVMTADTSAAAVWFDRTGAMTEPRDYAARLAEIAGDDLPRFQRLDAQMDAYHPNDAHWHLLFLAVRPDRQKQGLGGALMEHTHAQLEADGVPAYLEATGPRNVRLYRRHDYTSMVPPAIAVADGVDLYRMWRPAGVRR